MPSHAELTKHFWEDGAKKSIDESGIKESLRRALNDFTPRTEEIKKKITRDEMLEKLEKKECGFLAAFKKYFEEAPAKSQNDFDDWHHEMCEKFRACFNNVNFKNLQYGKAQKIVNMTFKNIYCLNGAKDKEDYFKYYHMPLDSLTLEWVYRNVKPTNKEKYTREKIPAWSKLRYENEGNAPKLSYKSIQEDIRKHFENSNEWTPLKAEFVIWPQIQLELAAEGLFNQLWHIGEGPDDAEYESCKGELRQASKIFKSKSVKDKLDYLKQHIDLSDDSFIFTDVNT